MKATSHNQVAPSFASLKRGDFDFQALSFPSPEAALISRSKSKHNAKQQDAQPVAQAYCHIRRCAEDSNFKLLLDTGLLGTQA